LASGLPQNQAQAIEEPRYTVISKRETFEVRDYPAYLVAEVTLQGSANDTGNAGFRILFRYITGKNRAQQKIEMTAPVSQQATGLKIPMTAPVKRQGAGDTYTLQFTMPTGWTLETLPIPEDSRVRLREMSAARYAVIRFTGLWTERNYEKHLAELRTAVSQANLEVVGDPVYSRYDPPFMPFFLRRNEIWLPISTD
jgi:DNA gyrase inhibitor GyrI